jgi:hypothetical protein
VWRNKLAVLLAGSALLLSVATAVSVTAAPAYRVSCVGSVNGRIFARLVPPPVTTVAAEARVAINKQIFRMISTTSAEGIIALGGLPKGTVTVKILPAGRRKSSKFPSPAYQVLLALRSLSRRPP